jgi:hypothetical protein
MTLLDEVLLILVLDGEIALRILKAIIGVKGW